MTKLRETKYNTVDRKKRRMDSNAPVDKGDILTIDPELLDDRFEYFWASDKPGNIAKKQAKDWDIVRDMNNVKVGDPETESLSSDGSMVTLKSGSETLILMSKKKEWCEADRLKMREHINKTENAIRQKNEDGFTKINKE